MTLNIFALNKELAAVKDANAKLTAEIAALTASLTDTAKKDELVSAQKLVEDLTASNLELGKQLEASKADVATAKASANKVAAQTVASLGIAEGTIKEASATVAPEPTLDELQATYNALHKTDPKAANLFFRKHEAAFLKAKRK